MSDGVFYMFGDLCMDSTRIIVEAVESGRLKQLWICSNGGDVGAAWAMYDALINRGVIVIGSGVVASAAVIPFVAGSYRLATPNCRFLLHPVAGPDPEAAILTEMMHTTLQRHTTIPLESIGSTETRFGVVEAIDWKLIHNVHFGRREYIQ